MRQDLIWVWTWQMAEELEEGARLVREQGEEYGPVRGQEGVRIEKRKRREGDGVWNGARCLGHELQKPDLD